MEKENFDVISQLDLKEQGVSELLFEFNEPPIRISYTLSAIRVVFINQEQDTVVIAHIHDGSQMLAKHNLSQMQKIPNTYKFNSPIINEALDILGQSPDLS